MKKLRVISLFLSLTGVAAFFIIRDLTDQKASVVNHFLYQFALLAVTTAIVLVLRRFKKVEFLKVGNLYASASPVKVLGISDKDNWKQIGIRFSIIISAATGAFLYFSNKEAIANASLDTIVVAMGISLPLALFNSFSERMITGWTIAEGFSHNPKVGTILSALIFGIPHYFGVPGGFLGMIMAGFLGWFLTRSIFDTRGIGWAVGIHFLQDVLIFSVLLLGVL